MTGIYQSAGKRKIRLVQRQEKRSEGYHREERGERMNITETYAVQ